jgi:Zn-dependent protease/predicted transcriptional regulator
VNTNIKLGKIMGIPIGLHASWFLIFFLITWSLATGYLPQEYPQISTGAILVLALITSILFFGSVLFHELGHSFFALRNNIPVKSITLFIFGGVAQIGREPSTPGAEFRIAIAGPLASLTLAGLFGGLYLLDQQIPYLAAPSLYLMRINLILALFNMIPGFPLDGGRVLRAIIWQLSKNFQRSTQIAAASGQVVAFGFIALGLFSVFNGQLMNGLWLAFIGWFLQSAASSAAQQVNTQERLRGSIVAQAMSRDCTQVPGLMTLNQIVQERVLSQGQHCFFVTDFGGVTVGMLTLQDITRIPQLQWRYMAAQEVMTPLHRLVTVNSDMELLAALRKMEEENLSQVSVVDEYGLVGMLSRDNVVRYLKLRTDLKI